MTESSATLITRADRPVRDLFPAIQLTAACNKQCRACLRSANADSLKIQAGTFDMYLADLKTLGEKYKLKFQFVTGGEPTIWKSSGRDTVDVLASLVNLGLIETITMPTNGKLFEDINYARDFFKRLSSRIERHIVVGVSIAEYQENLSDTGYIAFDNLLALSKEPGMKFLPVILVTLSVDDDTDVRLKKIYPGVFQRVTPLAPMGDAADMGADCPALSLSGNDKSGAGSFLPYFKKDVMDKLKVSADEFDTMKNSVIIDRLSLHAHCGASPFIDGVWHYCLPFKEDAAFDLCSIGEMKNDTLEKFNASVPFLKYISRKGVLSAVDMFKERLTPDTRSKLEHLLGPGSRVSVAYRGCMACKALYDVNVISELCGAVKE